MKGEALKVDLPFYVLSARVGLLRANPKLLYARGTRDDRRRGHAADRASRQKPES